MLEGLEVTEIAYSKLNKDIRIDSEYFKKVFLNVDSSLTHLHLKSLSSVSVIADGDHATFPTNQKQEVVYLQARDIKGNFLELNDLTFVSHEYFLKNQRSKIGEENILLSIMGSVGGITITPKHFKPCMANRAIAIIRDIKLNPYFAFAFLITKYSALQIERQTCGGVQQRINLDALGAIQIPILTPTFQTQLESCVLKAQKLREFSTQSLIDAENILTAALGLGDWQPPEPLTYTRRASEAFGADRIDADYFNPAKKAFLERLGSVPGKPLAEHYRAVREMFDPTAAKAGELVRNFDLTDALQPVLDDEQSIMPAFDVGSSKKRFVAGDVVISRLRAYLREIALVRTSPTVPTVGSSEFIVLRPCDAKKPALSRAALLIFLRSHPVQTILKWSQDGSHHPRFGEEDLMSIPVPDAVCTVAPQIEKVFECILTSRTRARALLEHAKRAVEIAIEQSEAAALAFLSSTSNP